MKSNPKDTGAKPANQPVNDPAHAFDKQADALTKETNHRGNERERTNREFAQKQRKQSVGKWFHIPVSLWQSNVHFFIGDRLTMAKTMPDALTKAGYNFDTMRRVCETFREQNPDWLNPNTKAGDVRSADTDVFIRLNAVSFEVSDIGLMWHECLHAANIILRNVNLLGDSNVEGLAYTQEFIGTQFLKEYIASNEPVSAPK